MPTTNETATESLPPHPGFDPKCANYHFGVWSIEPEWFKSAVNAVREGLWPAQKAEILESDKPQRRPYVVHKGVAVVPIAGPMMKARSKFGGTSTVDTRTSIRQAVSDDSVTSILVLIDSPGGTVAGTDALAQDIANADRQKPTYAHIEDCGASAAYWVASQARRITASPTSLVGSLGAMMVLDDFSKNYELKGIKTYLISSGGMKGAGAEGTEVTEEQRAYFQGLVDESTQHFKNAVMQGRKLSAAKADAIFDGRVHDAERAKSMGLIDAVVSVDSAITEILTEIESEDDEIETNKKKAASIAKEVLRLGTVAMNPEELLATVATVLPAVSQLSQPAPEPSQRSDAPPVVHIQETLPMSTEATVAPAQTPAAEGTQSPQASLPEIPGVSPQEIQALTTNWRNDGAKAGREQEQARFKKIVEACPGDPQMAIDSYLGGQTPEAVKLAFEASKRVKAQADQEIGRIKEENKRAVALAAAGGYPGGVSMGVESSVEEFDGPMTAEDAQAAAGREWDRNPQVRKGFTKKDRYVAVRAAEMRGQFQRSAQASA